MINRGVRIVFHIKIILLVLAFFVNENFLKKLQGQIFFCFFASFRLKNRRSFHSVFPTISFILDFYDLWYIIEDMISSTGLYTINSNLFEVIICLNFLFHVYWNAIYTFLTFSFILSCWEICQLSLESVFHVLRIFNNLL